MPTVELGTYIWGADEASEITNGGNRPNGSNGTGAHAKSRRTATRPTAPAASLRELERRLAVEFRVRREQSTIERRALVEGISSALQHLRVEFEERLEESLRAEVGAIEIRLSQVLKADRSTGSELAKVTKAVSEVQRSIEALAADLRKSTRSGEAGKPGTRASSADARRIDRLKKSIDALRTEIRAGLGAKADLKDLRGAVTIQRRQQKATTELRAHLDELSKQTQALGKPRTAPRLAKELEALERRIRSMEQAVPRRIDAGLNRALGPLEESLGEAIEEIRTRVEAIDPERLQAVLESLEGSAHGEQPPAPPRRRFRRERG